MEEIWRDINGYDGKYEISNKGRIKSLKGSRGQNRKKYLKPSINTAGYLRVDLSINGKRRKFYVHRLVGIAFINNKNNKPCINHKNGIKSINWSTNLEWVTYQENSIHSFNILGFRPVEGESHCNAKLTNKDIEQIRSILLETNILQKTIAGMYGVTQSLISDIKNRNRWKHI